MFFIYWYVWEIKLILVLVSGKQLRQDDPLALKDIVQMATEQTSNRTELLRYVLSMIGRPYPMLILKQQTSSRARFLMESLTNLKNNKIKKADTSTADTIERMKKLGQNLSKRNYSM